MPVLEQFRVPGVRIGVPKSDRKAARVAVKPLDVDASRSARVCTRTHAAAFRKGLLRECHAQTNLSC